MASLAVLKRAIARPVLPDEPAWCECGRPKESQHECCSACAFLDGIMLRGRSGPANGRNRRADVIAALRTCDRLTLNEIAIAVYGEANKSTMRMMHRVLHELMAEGRVSRCLVQESDPLAYLRGWHGSPVSSAIERWCYSLVGGAS